MLSEFRLLRDCAASLLQAERVVALLLAHVGRHVPAAGLVARVRKLTVLPTCGTAATATALRLAVEGGSAVFTLLLDLCWRNADGLVLVRGRRAERAPQQLTLRLDLSVAVGRLVLGRPESQDGLDYLILELLRVGALRLLLLLVLSRLSFGRGGPVVRVHAALGATAVTGNSARVL